MTPFQCGLQHVAITCQFGLSTGFPTEILVVSRTLSPRNSPHGGFFRCATRPCAAISTHRRGAFGQRGGTQRPSGVRVRKSLRAAPDRPRGRGRPGSHEGQGKPVQQGRCGSRGIARDLGIVTRNRMAQAEGTGSPPRAARPEAAGGGDTCGGGGSQDPMQRKAARLDAAEGRKAGCSGGSQDPMQAGGRKAFGGGGPSGPKLLDGVFVRRHGPGRRQGGGNPVQRPRRSTWRLFLFGRRQTGPGLRQGPSSGLQPRHLHLCAI